MTQGTQGPSFRVEVTWRNESDGRTVDLLSQLSHMGLSNVASVEIANLYFLKGNLSSSDIERIANEFLADPVTEGYQWHNTAAPQTSQTRRAVVEVGYHPGVTDPVARHVFTRAHQLGIDALQDVTTGIRYVFQGALSPDDLHHIARELLCNDVIQSYTLGFMQPEFVPEALPSDIVEIIPIRDLDEPALAQLSKIRVLFLSVPEMQAIQAEFRALQRDPTDVELEILAQTWSEHCLHKTFKTPIHYRCEGGLERVLPGGKGSKPPYTETIPSLLKSYLRDATDTLARPWVRSAFVDNAGIIDFDDEYELSFKVETHNHPSALEPFGGANTGVGGVIRDIIGVSAKPIANTDMLCFGPLSLPDDQLPEGALHPRRIARGVVAGIEDYGNKMGIPTVSGAILYDQDYVANPLVYCGCVGIAPKGLHRNTACSGDLVVTLGGRTGRDGLHGATFSSAELSHDTGQTVGSVVQIGDPITEKAVLDAVMQARDEGLYTSITDCGAGGFSSAVGEMGEHVGVDIDLSDVPLKYPGLRPWEIWLSEAQERIVIAVPESNIHRLGEICDIFDVEWTVIGTFTGDKRLRIHYEKKVVTDMSMDFVHNGWPRMVMEAVWSPVNNHRIASLPADVDHNVALMRCLADPNVASKENVIRRYDFEVQGATVVKPLVGIADDGPSDAPVLRHLMTKGYRGLALGAGINPFYGQIDPYAMAWAAIDEALRNIVCVGGDPNQVALLDNFCWGNPQLKDRLGGLVRAAQGCHDAALAYNAPFISGKDSLNNEFADARGTKRTIPPTLLISSLAIVPDVRRILTMDLKAAGNLLYIVGETRDELQGSLFARQNNFRVSQLPLPVPEAITTMRALFNAIQKDLIRAAHDPSEGGLIVALAEMCIAGRLGLNIDLDTLPLAQQCIDEVTALFSESSTRFLVEVAPECAGAFEACLLGHVFAPIGSVTQEPILLIKGLTGATIIEQSVDSLVKCWKSADIV